MAAKRNITRRILGGAMFAPYDFRYRNTVDIIGCAAYGLRRTAVRFRAGG